MYRDGLRVMPYGRADSDYFSIEERRSKNAGRYFWSGRRMFGRIAITRHDNPNLKDKAGREGFIENRASKIFREIVQKILIDSADKHFGSYSKGRVDTIEDIREKKNLQKAIEDRNKLLSKERTRIRTAIKNNADSLHNLALTISDFNKNLENRIKLNSIDDLQALKKAVDDFAERIQDFSLSPIPTSLGRLEDDYRAYRKEELHCREMIKGLTYVINRAIEVSADKSDYEKANEVYRSKLASINNAITRYASRGKEVLVKQQSEFEELVRVCREQYKNAMEDNLEDLNLQKVSLAYVLEKLDAEHQKIEIENAQKLSPYITALERISEQIDLEGLAIHSMNESVKYQEEITRLHSLAQLGITVEIIGHELDGLDQELTHALKMMSNTDLTNVQRKSLELALTYHESLIDKLKFLSPLKLSGKKEIQRITGHSISEYINGYFSKHFENGNVTFTCTPEFNNFSIMELKSRIYPIFINLINNSIYWVQRKNKDNKEILLSFKDGEVVVSDNGPGVDEDDIDSLFTLFFTRKQRGGRGVGLYLCKQNLMAGGHSIRYETRNNFKTLCGANFALTFRGLIK